MSDAIENPGSPRWRDRLRKLQRITSSQRWIAEIDGLRFLAVTQVVLAHLLEVEIKAHPELSTGWFEWLARSVVNASGVELFFILSGFILSGPFLRMYCHRTANVSVPKFYARRLTRLEPTYFIAVTLWLILKVVHGGYPLGDTLGHYFSTLTYTHLFVFDRPSTLLFAAWSLEIEVQFYLLMPLLARLIFPRSPLIRGLGYMVLILAPLALKASAPTPTPPILNYTLLTRMQFFAAGMALADLHSHDFFSRPSLRPAWLSDLLCVGCLLGMLNLSNLPPAAVPLCSCVLLSCIVWCTLAGGLSQRLFRLPVIATVGGMCYTIYLFQRMIMEVFIERGFARLLVSGSAGAALLRCGIGFFLVLVIGIVLFTFLERPFMNPRWPADLRAWLRSRMGVQPQ